ncbi:thioredoxin family protein [Capnocytophaga sp. ARDL2]|uniref:thioredoxin family protein n=1 Tax=Capnocytophaga sp. ARDL2 TaxID=3238809 RepID=UPI003557F505
MKTIFNQAYEQSMSYQEFLDLMDEKIKDGLSTGHEQNEILSNFTKLNRSRMKRVTKTVELLPELTEKIQNITEKQIWLVLTESWCGDAAQSVPVLNLIAESSPNIELRIVLRDDNDPLMQQYLTNGGRSIPKLIAIDASKENELFTWGPRPEKGTAFFLEQKEKFGGVTAEVKEALQKWYNDDQGQSLQQDILKQY